MRGQALFENTLLSRLSRLLKSLAKKTRKEQERLLAFRIPEGDDAKEEATLRDVLRKAAEDTEHSPIVVSASHWPEGLASPLTVKLAQEVLEQESTQVVAQVAQDLFRALTVMILPEYRVLLEDRSDLAAQWPWPPRSSHSKAFFALSLLVEQELLSPKEAGVIWPTDAYPAEVALWAEEAFTRPTAPASLKQLSRKILALSKEGRLTNTTLTWEDQEETHTLPPGGLALLYLAERRFRERSRSAPFEITPLSTERALRRTTSSFQGAHPALLSDKARLTNYNKNADPVRLEFTWEDGEELIVPYENSASPLLAIAHKYGPAAVKHLLALFAFSFAARVKAQEGFWWWPTEHLDLLGMSPSKENHASLRRWLKAMKSSQLRAESKDGKKLRAAIVNQSMDVIAPEDAPEYALHLHLHPSLYRGITDHQGKPGNHWWPIPMELLRLPASNATGRVHVLAPALSALFRAGLNKDRGDKPPTAKISTKRLATYLGISQEKDRDKDGHLAEMIRGTLETAKETGLIGEWRLEGGELDRLTGNLILTPGKSAVEIINKGMLPKPAYLPATNGDLKDWMKLQARSSEEIGRRLELPASTLRYAANQAAEYPLSPKIRSALRRYLWRNPDEPKKEG